MASLLLEVMQSHERDLNQLPFPLNGKRIVEWLIAHGLSHYPLTGFSGNNFDRLEPEVQRFFLETSAAYIKKGDNRQLEKLEDRIVFSRQWVKSIIE